MRIGVYGGSFNPVHLGHLIAAECCREQARLDRVLFVPAATPPHKQGHMLADAAHRVAMLNLAVGGHDAFAVSTIEVDRGGVSYTVDTLAALAERHPHDTLEQLHQRRTNRWKLANPSRATQPPQCPLRSMFALEYNRGR